MIINTRITKMLRRVALAGILLSPMFAFAAYDDVTLTTDAVINVDGVNLNVSGSSAAVQSIVVNPTNFSVTVATNSGMTVSSSDRKTFAVDPVSGAFTSSATCDSGSSTFTLTGTGAAETVTVSMNGTCATGAAASSGGGGGSPSSYGSSGGGGGGSASVQTVTTTTTNTGTSAVASPSVPSAGTIYTRPLSLGSTGDDVAALQTLLESKGFLTIPVGTAKGYFGNLTKKALASYQESVGIDPLGIVGPATRARLNGGNMPSSSTSSTPATSSASWNGTYSRFLSVGSTGDDVAALQTLLESKGFLTIPVGTAKGYFGNLTKKALASYQESVGIDPLGIVGPATRAQLNSL